MAKLKATDARAARNEARSMFPQGCNLTGFDSDGDCVYITAVRAIGDKHPVATARKGDARPVRFEAEALSA